MLEILHDGFWLVLFGLSLVYSLIVRLVIVSRKSRKLSVPVISVGNIHLGGTGKTPLVIKLAQHFRELNPAIASRGYKGKATRSGARCDLAKKHGPKEFGDEPWLIAQKSGCEVFVGKNRFQTLTRFQVPHNHSLVILDDGFQHTSLKRSVDLVLIPGEEDPAISACLPLGTLREPLSSLRRASAALITCGEEQTSQLEAWKKLIQQIAPDLPCFLARRKPFQVLNSQGKEVEKGAVRWGTFCGIARPERFFSDFKKWGSSYQELVFPDHYDYKASDIDKIVQAGREAGVSAWVTTEKDYVKVAPLFQSSSVREVMLFYAPIEYDYPSDLLTFIERKLGFK